jgi:LysR family glycine cleavage system transcriptional activator
MLPSMHEVMRHYRADVDPDPNQHVHLSMNVLHDALMLQLPPFDSLVAFEAALRLRSMTQAAAELGLTQSAVSHRIRRLEAFVGTALLHRRNAGISPTTAGEALVQELGPLLDELAGLKARCIAAVAPERLQLGVDCALAHNWLLRRLPHFTRQHPDVSIELVMADSAGSDKSAPFDLRLLWVPRAELRATMTQRPLLVESVFPVSRPSLLPPGFVVGDTSVLRHLPLVHKELAGRSSGPEWSWSAWLQRLALPPRPKQTLRFSSIGPAIAAAQEGAGVALARTLLVHDALVDGLLARVLPADWDMPCGKAYIMRWPRARIADPRVQQLVEWLSKQASETAEGI